MRSAPSLNEMRSDLERQTPQVPTPPRPPRWAEQLVRFLDDGIAIPGTGYRIGFDGIIGLLLPGAGDALTAAGALSLFWLAVQRGVPRVVLARMALNVAIDALVGAVPIVGDLFDFGWKANRRNLRLIERTTFAPEQKTPGDYFAVGLFALLIVSAIALPFLIAGLIVTMLLH